MYQKSFFDHVHPKFGIIHLRNELRGHSGSGGHLELPGLTNSVPQDNFVIVHFLKDHEFEVDDGRYDVIMQVESKRYSWPKDDTAKSYC